jgi:hypothetical protein
MPNKIPRVTEIIAAMFPERWKPDPWYLERGTLIHKACELHDTGELDIDSLDPQILPRVKAYWRFLDETEFRVELIEKRFTHSKYFYAGMVDRTGKLNGKMVLLDLKSGVQSETDKLQAGAYLGLLDDAKSSVNAAFDLYLKEDGSYRLIEVEKPRRMFNIFLAALTVWRFKEGE